MPNRKIKHIVAKLVGASTEETLDVYDVDAIHTDKIYNALDQTAAGYVLDARQGKALNDSLARSFTLSIAGSGVLEKSGNVCMLQYTIATFDPNGTVIPEGLRPKFGSSVWCPALVTSDYTHQYILQVMNTGRVSMQKNGNNVTEILQGVRGQISWIV